MKNTGIIRHIDELGRVTLPIEIRRSLGIEERDPIQIFVEDERIILKKAILGDIFTGESEDLISYEGKLVSRSSVLKLAELAGYTVTESKKK